MGGDLICNYPVYVRERELFKGNMLGGVDSSREEKKSRAKGVKKKKLGSQNTTSE